MDLPERIGHAHEAVSLAHAGGQRLQDVRGARVDGQADEVTQRLHVQAFGAAVDGHEAAREDRLVVQRLDLRVLHLHAALERADLAAERDLLAGLELLGDPGLAEPEDADRARVVADDRLGAAPVAADHDRLGRPDFSDHGLLFAERQAGDRPHLGVVVVAGREMIEDVTHGLQAQLLQARRVRTPQAQDGRRRIEGYARNRCLLRLRGGLSSRSGPASGRFAWRRWRGRFLGHSLCSLPLRTVFGRPQQLVDDALALDRVECAVAAGRELLKDARDRVGGADPGFAGEAEEVFVQSADNRTVAELLVALQGQHFTKPIVGPRQSGYSPCRKPTPRTPGPP